MKIIQRISLIFFIFIVFSGMVMTYVYSGMIDYDIVYSDCIRFGEAPEKAYPEYMTVKDVILKNIEKNSLDVKQCSQNPGYPTGCECVSLYMLLKFYGVKVTVEDIVDALPKGPQPYKENGKMYGANPEKEFVGDPKESCSYGVYNKPIAKTAEKFRKGAVSKKGADLADVIAVLESGQPLIAWFSVNPDKGVSYKTKWLDYETGEEIRWPAGEHAVVVCGCDEKNISYCDPQKGKVCKVSLEKFAEVFEEMGGRIVYYNK